jgi:hypothetical protein
MEEDLVPISDELVYEHAHTRTKRAGRCGAKVAHQLVLMLTPRVDDILFHLGLTSLCASPKAPARPDYDHGNDMLPLVEEAGAASTETGEDEDEDEEEEEDSDSSERERYSWLDDEAQEVDEGEEEDESGSREGVAGRAEMELDEVEELVQDTALLAPVAAANGAGGFLVFTVYEAGFEAFEGAWIEARRRFEESGRENVRDYVLLVMWALGDCDNWSAYAPRLREQGDGRVFAWGGARIAHSLELRLADEGLALALPPGGQTDIVWATR